MELLHGLLFGDSENQMSGDGPNYLEEKQVLTHSKESLQVCQKHSKCTLLSCVIWKMNTYFKLSRNSDQLCCYEAKQQDDCLQKAFEDWRESFLPVVSLFKMNIFLTNLFSSPSFFFFFQSTDTLVLFFIKVNEELPVICYESWITLMECTSLINKHPYPCCLKTV